MGFLSFFFVLNRLGGDFSAPLGVRADDARLFRPTEREISPFPWKKNRRIGLVLFLFLLLLPLLLFGPRLHDRGRLTVHSRK